MSEDSSDDDEFLLESQAIASMGFPYDDLQDENDLMSVAERQPNPKVIPHIQRDIEKAIRFDD